MRKRIIFFLATILLLPSPSFASIKINEIAWMGTAASQFAEWIELYNDGLNEVDLSGAGLYEGGGSTLIIALTKKIPAGGYYLIERTTASSPDPVAGIDDDSGSFGGGGLNNSGEFLLLKDKSGTVLDQIDASSGWPAGDKDTKETMQWNGNLWVTATATPKAGLPQTSVPATQSTANTASTTAVTESTAPAPSSHAGTSFVAPRIERLPLVAQLGRDRLGFVGVPLVFEGKAFLGKAGDQIRDVSFFWSFGDGGATSGNNVEHAYQFPGEYEVVMNIVRGDEKSTDRSRVTIVAPDLEITRAVPGRNSFVEILNRTKYEINLWKSALRVGDRVFSFPEDTIMRPGARIAFAGRITGLALKEGETVEIVWPEDRLGSRALVGAPPEKIAVLEKTVQDLTGEVRRLSVVSTTTPLKPDSRVASVVPRLLPRATPVSVPVVGVTDAILTASATPTPIVLLELQKPRGVLGKTRDFFRSFFMP